jgi:hypothetical protein
MVHPLFRLAAAHPQWLADHVLAYSDLMAEEVSTTAAQLQRRLVLQVAGLAGIAVAAVLCGVAVLLWAALPEAAPRQPWLLLGVPALPAALGAAALLRASAVASNGEWFTSLRRQLADDVAMLRDAGPP